MFQLDGSEFVVPNTVQEGSFSQKLISNNRTAIHFATWCLAFPGFELVFDTGFN